MVEKPKRLKLNTCSLCNGILYYGQFKVIPDGNGLLRFYCPTCAALVIQLQKVLDNATQHWYVAINKKRKHEHDKTVQSVLS